MSHELHGPPFKAEPASDALQQLWKARKRIAELEADIQRRENEEAAVCPEDVGFPELVRVLRAKLGKAERDLARLHTARPYKDWHEDMGPALWYSFPICEPPYVGTPLDDDFPSSELCTHWTPLPDGNEIQHRFDAARSPETVPTEGRSGE